MTRWTVLALALSACDLPGVSDWQPVVYVDEGAVCFEPSGTDVTVHVTVQDCMSSSCSRNFDAECSAVVEGTEITLQSDIRWEDDQGNVSCTDDCGIPAVSCTIANLAEGTYTVTFGTETFSLTVPVEGDCKAYR